MMTEELTICPKCSYAKALTHWDSSGMVSWIACPSCRTFFDHYKKKKYPYSNEKDFWKQVEQDTGFKAKPSK